MNKPYHELSFRYPADEENRERARRDFQTNLLMEAGAGTGKTRLLIERLFNLVIQEGNSLERIVAITFTEKAAAELKIRLREKLEDHKGGAPPATKRKIDRALRELEYAPMGTIHSFAASLLRERPVEAQIDPQMQIWDQGETEEFKHQAWEKWFKNELEAEREMLRKSVKWGFLPDKLRTLAFQLYQERGITEKGNPTEVKFSPQEAVKNLKDPAARLEELAKDCRDATDEGYQQIAQFLEWYHSLEQLKEEDQVQSFLLYMPEIKEKGNKDHWCPPSSGTEQKKVCRWIKELQQEIYCRASGEVTAQTVKWLREFVSFLEDEKARRGALDFGDLLLKTRKLLQENLEVRRYYQRSYDYLLVDEFQDTDPLQAEIIMFLAEKEAQAAQWNQVGLQPGKLFLVGDPKQSIYRFRGADIRMYEEVRQLVQRQGEELAITQNFRTVPKIIHWVNEAFSFLIEPVPDRTYQPDYQPLSPYRREKGEGLEIESREAFPPLSFFRPPKEWDGSNAEELRRLEARWLAEFIQEKVGTIPVETAEGKKRPLEYRDVAVLFPTTTGVHIYEEAFHSMQVPYRLEGGKLFYKRKEVHDLVALLTAVDNPHDQIAVVSTLRNIFGLSEKEMLFYAHRGGRFNYLQAGIESSGEFPSLQRSLEVLEGCHRLRRENPEMSTSAYLEHIVSCTGVRQIFWWQERSQQAVSNLKKILDLARLWEKREPITLRKFVSWLKDARDLGKEEAESFLEGEDRDSINMLTVHRAKGLEFRLVVLANLISGQQRPPLLVADRHRSRFEIRGGGKPDFSTYGYEGLKEDELRRQEAESRRLFYVACTRAQDYLCIPLTQKTRGGGYSTYLRELEEQGFISEERVNEMNLPVDADDPLIPQKSSVEEKLASGEEEAAREQGEGKKWHQKRNEWKRELQQRICSQSLASPILTASGLTVMPGGSSPLAFYAPGGEPPERKNDAEGVFKGRKAELGSAFHQVMEKINMPPDLGEKEALIKEAGTHWGLSRKDEAELKELMEGVFNSQLWDRAKKSLVYREVPFSLSIEGFILEGLIDLIIKEEEGWLIADYKTDRVTAEETASKKDYYLPQVYSYALAVEELTGDKVKEAGFFFVRPQVWTEISLPSRDRMIAYLFSP